MKILIIGGGGREHAIGLKLSQSPSNPELIFAPGNPGMEALGKCYPIASDKISELLILAKKEKVEFTIVGPEIPLAKGIVNLFQNAGYTIFGPSQAAAQLEYSKAFAKKFMARHHIPTAQFQNFHDLKIALDYLKKVGAPVVVKASGLAAGKGAVVCMTEDEAQDAIHSMLGPKALFGEAGHEIVIEEFMEGEEVSVFAVCDGTRFELLPTAQDHKRVFDGDLGPNTGGMGAYSPAPIMTQAQLEQTARDIIEPTLVGMRNEGHPYQGILFVGIMLTQTGPKVVEFNCRFGDPETQVVLPVFTGDLLNLLFTAAKGQLLEQITSSPNRHAAIVVAAAAGYPGAYQSGLSISGVESVNALANTHVIHAGTKQEETLKTAGGRVLGVVGESESLAQALKTAYFGISKIQFEGMHFRHDIGQRGLAQGKT